MEHFLHVGDNRNCVFETEKNANEVGQKISTLQKGVAEAHSFVFDRQVENNSAFPGLFELKTG